MVQHSGRGERGRGRGAGRRPSRRRRAGGSAAESLEPRQLLAGDGPVVVSELMYHAASQAVADEWVELYNRTGSAVDLAGWRFTKGVDATFAAGTTIGPGQYLVVARDLARFQATHPGVANVVGGWASGQLGNNGDTLRLVDATGATGDELTYGSQGDWAVRRRGPLSFGHQGWVWTTPADGGGASMELVNPALGNDSGLNWKPSVVAGGTPGAANSTAAADVAPLVLDLQQFPLVPHSTDAVTVSAKLADESTTGVTGTLRWRVDGAAGFNAAPMSDDGAHGDGGAGDGVFGAVLPPQPNNTVVEYYVVAADAGGHARTWPGPTDDAGTQGANLLYQVDDAPAPAGGQPVFKLVMTEAERAELAAIGGPNSPDRESNAAMNATFVATDGAGTEVRYTAGLRNRGGGSRDAQPNNYRLDLPNDRPWQDHRALALNAQYSMEEVAGSAVLRAAGVPAQDVVPVQVRVNNANLATATQFDMFGSYSFVEVENSDLTANHFPTDPQGNYYRGVDAQHNADLTYLGPDPAAYYAKYPKQTNGEANDYSDLIDLTRTFDPTQTPGNFAAAIGQRINVTEWLRYFAANTLLGNQETTLATGFGDDYSLYRGLVDPRFQVVAHDLDTVLGRGDTAPVVGESVFRAANLPTVSRLLKDPAFAPLYYAQLKELATSTFAAANINATLDNALGGYVLQGTVDTMKAFAAARVASVLSQIPTGVTATSSLAVQNGYYRTTAPSLAAGTLTGTADAIATRSVLVNGVAATWTAWSASWSAPSLALRPGLNRLVVQAVDGAGVEVARTAVDVWRDTGATANVSGTLPAGVTHWTAAGGPYRVTANLTVPATATLLIDPGTTVFFDAGVGMTVNGLLTAVGTDAQRIAFAKTPAAASAWDKILVANTQQDSKIAYAVFENAGSGGENVQVNNARLDMDHLEWAGTTTHIVDLVASSFRLTNSVIPDTTGVEPVHFAGGLPADGYALIQGNTFGHVTGHNDVVDFTGGNRPGPIVQFLDNTFLGTGPNGTVADDILDLDGTDAHIEGNVFMNVPGSGQADTNSVISGGGDSGNTSEIVSVRNFFYNVDHAFLMKEGNSVTSVNDTIVHVLTAVFNFDEPGFAAGPGLRGWAVGDVFYDVPVVNGVAQIVQNPPTGGFTVTRSIVGAGTFNAPGTGNVTGDPHLANTTAVTNPRVDFQLRGGPAVGLGYNGRDAGAAVPAGASVAGEPPAVTDRTSATLTVGGPDIYAYKYRVNGGPWSAEVPVTDPGLPTVSIPPIELTGLADGTYTVQVAAKNSAGAWQPDAAATTSRTWTVSATSGGRVVLNEVLAKSDNAAQPDLIELYNDSTTARDLGGMSLSDDPAKPRKYVFPAGTTIPAGGYIVVFANDPDGSPGLHAGFALDADGEGAYLFDTPANGGGPLDGITFGTQLPDLSIGRLGGGGGVGGTWGLTVPTFGAVNVAKPVGDSARLKINEWLTSGFPPFNDDFVELYNPDPLPVALGGLSLTDNVAGAPGRSPIPALSFVAGGGYATFVADGKANTPGHADFKLAQDQGTIGLMDAALKPIDVVVYGSQKAGYSQGRVPDGGPAFGFFQPPNPGVSNPAPTVVTQTTNYNLIGFADVWRYNQTQNLDGVAWTAKPYNDAAAPWAGGGGLLYVESSGLPAAKTTPLTLGRNAYYFRKHFTLDADPATLTALNLQTVLDDGAVIYVNGHEVLRVGMAATGTITYASPAGRNVDNAVVEGPFPLLAAARPYLVRGDNVIAVEVHQATSNSSDIVWGATLSATATVTTTPPPPPAVRVSELNFAPGGPSGPGLSADDYEFVELTNTGPTPVQLAGMAFTAGVSFTFPDYTLAPGAAAVVVRNPAAFAARYGTGVPVVGTYAGSLDDGGEQVRLVTADGAVVTDFSYSAAWYPATAGDGYTLRTFDPGGDASALSLASSWRASRFVFGSPGLAEPTDPADTVVINELLAHSHGGAGDWVEFRNTTAADVDISGWYLSDTPTDLLKYRLPAGTVVPAGGYLVLDEATSFGTAFGFSEAGDSAYLSASAAPGVLGGYRQGVRFGASESDVPFGRYVTSTGRVDFVPMSAPTRGAANAAPKVGPLVINEVMYHPPAGSGEYVELRNLTGDPQPLYDPANPQNVWRFTAGIDFAFPAGAIVPASGYALVVAGDPAQFRARYAVPADVAIYGPYAAADGGGNALDNAGERLTLSRPLPPDAGSPTVAYADVDSVAYSPAAPWPAAADGGGPSLARVDAAAYADDPANWQAGPAGGTPGRPNAADAAPALLSIVPSAGAAQRSQVRSVALSFDRPVTLAAGAVTLVRLNAGGSGLNDGSAPTDASAALATPTSADGGRTWTFTFAASALTEAGGSLKDGVYTLSIDPAGVLGAGGPATAGGSLTFHRKFGDQDGNKTVNNADYVRFRAAFGSTAAGGGAYDPIYDFDGNGAINNLDYVQLRARFGTAFTYG